MTQEDVSVAGGSGTKKKKVVRRIIHKRSAVVGGRDFNTGGNSVQVQQVVAESMNSSMN